MLIHANISHYKSLAEINLSFSRANIIVGLNGSGKSNLVDCLSFVKEAANEDLDYAATKRHGVESIRQWSRSRPYNITIELFFRSSAGNGSYKLNLASARGSFKVVEENGSWHGQKLNFPGGEILESAVFLRSEDGTVRFVSNLQDDKKFLRDVNVPVTELFLTQLSSKVTSFQSLMFRSLQNEIDSLSIYAIYPNTIKQPQVVSKDERLAQDGSNLAAIIKRLNSGLRRNKERLIDGLRVVLPIVSDIQIKSAGGFYVPLIRVREPNGDQHDLNMSQISDGTLRILGLLSAFYQPDAPQKIAVEEPEQMIHPGLLPILRDSAEDYLQMVNNSQFFMTTHSPNLIDLFDPSDVIWVSFKNGVSEAGKISSRQMDLVKKQLFSVGELLLSEGIGS